MKEREREHEGERTRKKERARSIQRTLAITVGGAGGAGVMSEQKFSAEKPRIKCCVQAAERISACTLFTFHGLMC